MGIGGFNYCTIALETLIENQPSPVDIEGIKMKIKNNLLNVLITNNHILNENDIKDNNIIKFIAYNKAKNRNIEIEIIMDESRKRFTYKNDKEGIDITIIEIKPNKDKINNYLDIDIKILELECEKKSIYLLHYKSK